MNRNYWISIVAFILTSFWGYAIYSDESRETNVFTPRNSIAKCQDNSGGSYIYFRNSEKTFRSRKFKTSCANMMPKLGSDWELGVKEGTSIVVYLKSGSSYVEGNEVEFLVDFWMVALFVFGLVISVKGFLYAIHANKVNPKN